jgi:predicted MFS family arabinose efflux permease
LQSWALTEKSLVAWLRADGAVAFITGVSTVLMGTLPLLNGLFAERLDLDWARLGWLGTAAQGGMLGGTLLGYWVTGRGALRLGVQLGAACAIVAWLYAAFAETFVALVIARTVTAIGIGCVFSIGTYALARTAVPARSFSIMSGIQVACGALQSGVLGWVHSSSGYTAAVSSVAVWFVLILLLAPRVSDRKPSSVDERMPASARNSAFSGAGLLLSVMAFQMAMATFWGYSERIAVASGRSGSEIATAIAVGNLGGVPAAVLGSILGERFGYMPLLLLATLAAIGGELAINFGWMLGVSYYLGLLAKGAADTRMIQIAPVALVIAGALGPLWIALLHASSGRSLLLFSASLCCAALIPVVVRRA